MTNTLTGKHVFAIFGSAFAVIVAVNLTLAFQAVATFPGLETKNSYVVSQQFEQTRSAQLALGWDVQARYHAGVLTFQVKDTTGPIAPEITQAVLGRATHVASDITPEFTYNGAAYVAQVGPLDAGNWNLRLIAKSDDGTVFRQRIVLRVAP